MNPLANRSISSISITYISAKLRHVWAEPYSEAPSCMGGTIQRSSVMYGRNPAYSEVKRDMTSAQAVVNVPV